MEETIEYEIDITLTTTQELSIEKDGAVYDIDVMKAERDWNMRKK